MSKKILVLLCIILFGCTGCIHKILVIDTTRPLEVLAVIMPESDSTVYWGTNWTDDWKYEWDQKQYGRLGYGVPDSVVCTTWNISDTLLPPFWTKRIKLGNRVPLPLSYCDEYSILIYTDTDYYHYGPNGLWTDYSGDSPSIQYRAFLPSFCLSNIPKEDFVESGTSFKYYFDVSLEPLTYIYLVQVILENDDSSYPMDLELCTRMAMRGVAKRVDLISGKSSTETCNITSTNVKPIQLCQDSSMVFAERLLSYGLAPVENSENSSWGVDVQDIHLELTLHFKTGIERTGRVDITSQMSRKPRGGVITLMLKNGDLHKELGDGQEMGPIVTDWTEITYFLTL